MAVEDVKVEDTQVVDVPQEESTSVAVVEETKNVVDEVKAEGNGGDDPNLKVVQKSSSYREESNLVSDLKDFEKKALSELKSKLEEAILGNKLFKKEETKKEVNESKEEEETKEEAREGEECEKQENKEEEMKPAGEPETVVEEEIDTEISIWGVKLLPGKGDEGLDVVLLKFLRARDFKVDQSLEMLKKTLQWRKETKVDTLLEDHEFSANLTSAFYMNGVDREGHPICYNKYGVLNDEEVYNEILGSEEKRKQFLKWRVQLMEKGVQKLDLKPGTVCSLLQISDLKNSPPPSKKELRIAMKQTVTLLQDNYPEFVARNMFINAPFWYYALNAMLSPFITQRTKSKFVVARPSQVTKTLLKYIPVDQIPAQYGGFNRENDFEFCGDDGEVSEVFIKAGSTATIEIPVEKAETTLIWDLTVLGWEVNYKEEFVPSEEGSYTIIIQKNKKMVSTESPIRNTFKNTEPGKVVLTIENGSNKKRHVLYRFKIKKTA